MIEGKIGPMSSKQRNPKEFRNRGVEIPISPIYEKLEREAIDGVEPLWKKYPKASKMWDLLTTDLETRANWDMANYLTASKMAFNDHGETHARIVAANGVLIYDLLVNARIVPDVVRSGAGDEDDACAVIVAACLLHDVGNQVNRQGHELAGVMMALPVLDRVVREYPGVRMTTIVTSIGAQPGPLPEEFLAEKGLTFPVAVDDTEGTLARAFGIASFPTTYFIDADGVVREVTEGEIDEQALRDHIEAIRG